MQISGIGSASGFLAPLCLHFHGLADTELHEDFIVMEVPGLVPGGICKLPIILGMFYLQGEKTKDQTRVKKIIMYLFRSR